jgi:hypothetical protein
MTTPLKGTCSMCERFITLYTYGQCFSCNRHRTKPEESDANYLVRIKSVQVRNNRVNYTNSSWSGSLRMGKRIRVKATEPVYIDPIRVPSNIK